MKTREPIRAMFATKHFRAAVNARDTSKLCTKTRESSDVTFAKNNLIQEHLWILTSRSNMNTAKPLSVRSVNVLLDTNWCWTDTLRPCMKIRRRGNVGSATENSRRKQVLGFTSRVFMKIREISNA